MGLKDAETVVVVEEERLKCVPGPDYCVHEHKYRTLCHTRADDVASAEFADRGHHVRAVPRQFPPPFEELLMVRSHLAGGILPLLSVCRSVREDNVAHVSERPFELLCVDHIALLEIDDEALRRPVAG